MFEGCSVFWVLEWYINHV